MNRGWIPPDTDIDQFQVRRQSLPAEISKALRSSEARRMDHVIVPSKYLKRMVIGWGVQPERITVIYNAVQLTTLPDLSQAAAREALGLRDGPLLLTAARLTAWKGIDHTLHALSRVPDIQLIIAGDGPERSSLEALSERLGLITRVQFLGQVARDALPLFMKASDYCLLYSGYEGLSHTLLEALSVGTPVIASDKGGNPEIVSDGINGLLAPYINIEALADTLARAFETGLRSRLAAGTHAGMERFGWDSMIASTINTLLEFGGG
jgi:glycosyltransferase involved in cell wall biosynthesis